MFRNVLEVAQTCEAIRDADHGCSKTCLFFPVVKAFEGLPILQLQWQIWYLEQIYSKSVFDGTKQRIIVGCEESRNLAFRMRTLFIEILEEKFSSWELFLCEEADNRQAA